MSRRTGIISRSLSSTDFLPAFRSAAVGTSKIVRPSTVTLPTVGSMSRRMTLPSVVLPQPDSPTRPSVSPRRTLEGHAVDGPDGADRADAEQAAA